MILRKPSGSDEMEYTMYAYYFEPIKASEDLKYLREHALGIDYTLVKVIR